MRDRFVRLSRQCAVATGSPWAFMLSVAIVVVWAISGPIFSFSDTWQLIINTGTTVATFLMVFLIQATQNREAKAMQLKLDELVAAVDGARNSLKALEDVPEEEFKRVEAEVRPESASGA